LGRARRAAAGCPPDYYFDFGFDLDFDFDFDFYYIGILKKPK